MRRLIVGRGAKGEMKGAGEYYESEGSEELKEEFIAEVDRAFGVLRQNAFVGSPYHLQPFRKYVLRRFPFNVFYSVKSDVVYVVALAHHSRKPV